MINIGCVRIPQLHLTSRGAATRERLKHECFHAIIVKAPILQHQARARNARKYGNPHAHHFWRDLGEIIE